MSRLLLLPLLCCVACGTTPEKVDAGTDIAGCLNDPRVAAYSPGMSEVSISGSLRFELLSSDPAPPIRGTNSWKVRVVDTEGQAVTGLSLVATSFMPDHGHGSSVIPQITAESDGTYTVNALYFFMPGVWRVTLATAADGGPSDSAEFFFCIEG